MRHTVNTSQFRRLDLRGQLEPINSTAPRLTGRSIFWPLTVAVWPGPVKRVSAAAGSTRTHQVGIQVVGAQIDALDLAQF